MICKEDMQKKATLNEKQRELAQKIKEVYGVFGIRIGPLIGVESGQGVTRFDFQVESDAVFPKILKLRDDISLFLSVPPAQLVCPIPGKMAFSIEIATK